MKYANAINAENDRLFPLNCNEIKRKSSYSKHFKQKAYKQKPNKRTKCNDGNVGLYQMLNAMIRMR